MNRSALDEFEKLPLRQEAVGENVIAYRQVGTGPVLVLIHGWPLHSATYRFILPELSKYFTCILPDSLGMGKSQWLDTKHLIFTKQAAIFKAFITQLGISSYHLIAHNTGATIARLLAANDQDRVQSLAILNTEIMHERPQLVPLFQRLLRLPGMTSLFAQLFRSRHYLNSYFGLRNVFYDKTRLNQEFIDLYLKPVIEDKQRRKGAFSYFTQIDWTVVDDLEAIHRQIAAPVKFIWGANDLYFPLHKAKKLVGLSKHCHGMDLINEAGLLPHEEQPDKVLKALLQFWRDTGVLNANKTTKQQSPELAEA